PVYEVGSRASRGGDGLELGGGLGGHRTARQRNDDQAGGNGDEDDEAGHGVGDEQEDRGGDHAQHRGDAASGLLEGHGGGVGVGGGDRERLSRGPVGGQVRRGQRRMGDFDAQRMRFVFTGGIARAGPEAISEAEDGE